jgi:hypothetical protein
MNSSAHQPTEGNPGRRSPWWLALGLILVSSSLAQEAAPNSIPAATSGLVFYPPVPPPLGSPIPAASRPADPKQAAPGAMAAYVDEPFYAPLAVRLERNDLGDALAFRLENYLSTKTALLAELRARLYTLRDADPATRTRELTAFAREQTPQIADLEKNAEQLRLDLLLGQPSRLPYPGGPADAEALSRPAGPALDRELAAVRTALFYGEGLSPAQRRLLREVAIELAEAGNAAPSPGDPSANSLMFFSPETARIRLPNPLAPELASEVGAYRREKSALKTELLVALLGSGGTPAGPAHIEALRNLAAAQAPRFSALENLAETIRRGLATLQDPSLSPAMPVIPPELAARITAYHAEKLALQRALLFRIAAVSRMRLAGPGAERLVAERVRITIAEFTQENAARYAALEQSKDAIRADLAKLPGANANGSSGSSADALLIKFSQSLHQVETFWDYRDYQTAVFQPGLSPEQRRLLFDGALQKLALPLPDGQPPPRQP